MHPTKFKPRKKRPISTTRRSMIFQLKDSSRRKRELEHTKAAILDCEREIRAGREGVEVQKRCVEE